MEALSDQDSLKTAALAIATQILINTPDEWGEIHLVRQLAGFADHIVAMLEKDNPDIRVACGVKCSYCCHMQVKVTPPEALFIHAYIQENKKRMLNDVFFERVRNNRQLTEGKKLDERVREKLKTPCIFLNDHACSIYPVRPLVCRAWHSLNKAGCRAAFDSQNAGSLIDTAPERNYVYSTISSVLEDICREKKQVFGRYELPAAMDMCFHFVNPLKSWWFSEDLVFSSV